MGTKVPFYIPKHKFEKFILEMISLAKAYGFNVNIKDGDNENIAVSAIASEVYRGSIINIISALGS